MYKYIYICIIYTYVRIFSNIKKSRNTWDQTYCLRHMEKKLANFTQWGLAAFPNCPPKIGSCARRLACSKRLTRCT